MTEQLPGDTDSYAIAHEEAKRSIDFQVGSLDEVRARAGNLLGAASIGASFLGGIALADHKIGLSGIGAVLAFIGVAFLASLILRVHRWSFVVSPEKLVDEWIEGLQVGPAEMHRGLAIQLGKNHKKNQDRLNRLWSDYEVGLWFLVGMIVAWLLELAGVTMALKT